MRSVRVALAAGLALTVAALAVTLSSSPISVAATNSIPGKEELGIFHRGVGLCQPGEAIPRGTSAIRLAIFSFLGPKVTLKAYSGARVVADGERESGWTGWVVTIPVKPLTKSISDVKLCFTIHLVGDEMVKIIGVHQTTHTAFYRDGRPLEGRVRVEYLRPGKRSWWSLASLVAHHMGFGHADSGPWSVFLVITLAAAVTAGTLRLVLRELR